MKRPFVLSKHKKMLFFGTEERNMRHKFFATDLIPNLNTSFFQRPTMGMPCGSLGMNTVRNTYDNTVHSYSNYEDKVRYYNF